MILENEMIVLKFGTTSVCDQQTLEIREDWMLSVVEGIQRLVKEGNKVVLFTSGGLATGKKKARSFLKEDEILPNKKILGAMGLSELLFKWQQAFETHQLQAATLAIREEDVETTSISALIKEMAHHNIIPIINENIPLQEHFNNDELASKVCKKIGATKFILFTDTDGVFTDNPKTNPAAKHLPEIDIQSVNVSLEDEKEGLGSGGMKAKLTSAIMMKKEGIDTIIANGVDFYPISNLDDTTKYTVLVDNKMTEDD